jgi:hypothetical protein
LLLESNGPVKRYRSIGTSWLGTSSLITFRKIKLEEEKKKGVKLFISEKEAIN